MNRRIATLTLLTAGLLLAGCGATTETTEMKRAQLQSHVDTLDALQVDLKDEGADASADTTAATFLAQPLGAVSSSNSLTSSMIAQIRLVLTQGTAASNAHGALVATLDDDRRFTWKVVAEVEPNAATFTLQIKPQASADTAYVTIVSGQATRTQSSRQGSFSVDLDALKTVDTSTYGQGQFFIAFVADSAAKRVCARLTHFTLTALHPPIDASLAVSVQMGSLETRVHFEYASAGLLGAKTATHELRILPHVGGRGELAVAGGSLGLLESIGCWNRQSHTLYFKAKTCLLGSCADVSVQGDATECDSVLKMEEPLAVGQPGCEGLPPEPPNGQPDGQPDGGAPSGQPDAGGPG